MSRKKTHVSKGDEVLVIAGNHKGSTGKIMQVLSKKDRVIIEGVHMIKKHVRRSQDHPQGAIVEREGSIHISNVKAVEVTEAAPTKKKAAAKAPAKSTKKKTKAEAEG